MKVCYVLRDCLLPIKDIAQTMFRDDFEHMTDKTDLVYERISGVVDRMMARSEDVKQRTEMATAKYISTLDFSLERLQQLHNDNDPDACSAIERVRALNPPLAAQLSEYQSAVERNHAIVLG